MKYKLFLLSTFVVIILLLEIFVRIFYSSSTYLLKNENIFRFMKKDSIITWTLKENQSVKLNSIYGDFMTTIKTNSKGFRNEEFNKTDILILGDSMTLGFGVENNETYPYYMAKYSNKSIVNGGYIGGMSTDTQYLWLKNNWNKIKPKVVIFAFHPDTDYADIEHNIYIDSNGHEEIKTYYDVTDEGELYKPTEIPSIFKNKIMHNLNRFLSAHSYLYQFVKNNIFKVNSYVNYSKTITPDSVKRLNYTIKNAKELSLEYNFTLIFFIMPTIDNFNNSQHFDYLIEELNQSDISYINPLGFLKSLKYKIDFNHDKHYNKFTNKDIAKYLYDSINVLIKRSERIKTI